MIKDPLYSKNICPVSGSISIYAFCDHFRITVHSIMVDEQGNIRSVRGIDVCKEFINMPKNNPQNPSWISEEEFYDIYDKVVEFIDNIPTNTDN